MNISGFPYFEVQFTKEGDVFDAAEVADLTAYLEKGEATDLIVISHGWNNDISDARSTYKAFFESMRSVLDGGRSVGLGTRKLAILGVLWPSKKFADKELIPSGAASGGSPVTNEALTQQLEELKGFFTSTEADAKLDKAKKLIPHLQDDPAARKRFADLMRTLAPKTATDQEDASMKVFSLDGEVLMQRLSKPVLPTKEAPGPSTGGSSGLHGPQGGASSLFSFFTGPMSAARNLLNYLTYYQMKERAGIVGRRGVNQVVRNIRKQFPSLKIHMVGHSFGGRLVTAATGGTIGQSAVKPNSLILLQAAFSHYGFAEDYEGTLDGAFRQVLNDHMVDGPVLITCTKNDQAVGIAYPLASLIAGQVAAGLGDKNDRYGGIGRNGAQKTPEVVEGELLATSGIYEFISSKVYNLNSDLFIKDHGDISGNEVMHAVLSAIAST